MTETYTFSRALHLMRYSGKKMRSTNWLDPRYLFVKDGMLLTDVNGIVAPFAFCSNDIMGNWIEVKDDL
jgi:hypothetical protein